MATTADLLTDAYGRIRDTVHNAVGGLGVEQLAWRADQDANSLGWLVWHLSRVQDEHVAGVAGTDQAWTGDGWHERFGLPFAASEIGYGQSSDDVAAVRAQAADLIGYHDAVHKRTVRYVRQLSDADLDRVVDEGWDPPVTLAARLISVVNDDMQHAGQAAFVRGLVLRAG